MSLRWGKLGISALGAGAAFGLALSAFAQVTCRVTFDDPLDDLSAVHDQLESHIQAGCGLWAPRLAGTGELWVRVTPSTEIATVECTPFIWSYFDTVDGLDIFETCVATHVRNGYPASTFDPDIEIRINPAYAADGLWFEADPWLRDGTPDAARLDAVSVFGRGLGRCLGFDGWKQPDGTYPANMASRFDRLITISENEPRFEGADATVVYGSPVPLTIGQLFCVGNEPPGPGSDLTGDIMSGIGLSAGVRYWVSELDFAMLRDAGVPVTYLCPCDLNADGFVDDADFMTFSQQYDMLDCADPGMPSGCPSDFNHDGMVEDLDYVIFVQAYQEFICP